MALGWRLAKLGGGGGINGIAWSDDGSVLLSGGDVSGPERSEDRGTTWSGGRQGLFSEASTSTTGGLAFKAGSSTDALYACKAGLFRSSDGGASWARVGSPTGGFGAGGGARPRPNVGPIVACSSDYGYAVDIAGKVCRYRFSTGTFTANVATLSGTGEGIALDPSDGTKAIAVTRTGAYLLQSLTGTATASLFTGTNAPNDGLAVSITAIGSTRYCFVADDAQVLRLSTATTWGTADAWSNVTPAGGADFISVDAINNGGDLRVAVGCGQSAPSSGGEYANVYLANNAESGTPTWTAVTQAYTLQNEMGGPGGEIYWSLLDKADGGNNGTNCLVADNATVEDIRFDPTDPDYLVTGGQGGCWLIDIAGTDVFPLTANQAVTVNTTVITDPNSPELIYIMNTDHGVFFSTDGETYRKNENPSGFFTGSGAGFDLSVDSGVTLSSTYYVHGNRDLSGGGGLYWSDDVTDLTDWHQIGVTGMTGTPVGVAARRASDSGTTRVFVFLAIAGQGVRRAKLTTASPPAVYQNLISVSGPSISYSSQAEWAPIYFLSDDEVVCLDRSTGLWMCKNARAVTPTFWKIWNIPNDHIREGYIAVKDDDTCYVSIGSGGSKGVYKLTGLASATAGTDTVENGGITDTAVSDPGGGSWTRPGPLNITEVNGSLRLVLVDASQEDDGSADSTLPEVFLSTSAAMTSFTEITDAEFQQGFTKWGSITQTSNGKVYVSMIGPGLLEYTELSDEPPPEPADRTGQVSWAEFQVPDAARRGEVSWAEMQVTDAPRRGEVSWAEMQVESPDRQLEISWAQMQVPDPGVEPRASEVSWAEMEAPDPPSTDRAAEVSWASVRLPDPPPEPGAAEPRGRSPKTLVPIEWDRQRTRRNR